MREQVEPQEESNLTENKKDSVNSSIEDIVVKMAQKPKRVKPQTNMTYWVTNPNKEKRRYTQSWHEYNLAQTNEKIMFMDMLKDLTGFIKIRKKTGRGRPKLSVHDMIFCMGMFVYVGKSSRRLISELRIAKDRGLISKVPHFNSVLNYFNNMELKTHLEYLLTLSSCPLKFVEKDFAADASGFTTSVFGRWFDEKWGTKTKKEGRRLWRKAHVMSGVKTNIITSIEITRSNVADTTKFPQLVNHTNKNFQLREVSADMAYLSRSNLELVSSIGAIPFIPFKSNVTGKARGSSIWKKMYMYFVDHFDEFMMHYHKRSNAETVFSMMKKKYGMHLRTKTEDSQDNEILCKALCHNISVLIHETFELGVSTDFEEFIGKMKFCADSEIAQIFTA